MYTTSADVAGPQVRVLPGSVVGPVVRTCRDGHVRSGRAGMARCPTPGQWRRCDSDRDAWDGCLSPHNPEVVGSNLTPANNIERAPDQHGQGALSHVRLIKPAVIPPRWSPPWSQACRARPPEGRMAVAATRAPCSSIPGITCKVSWVNETDECPSRSLTTLTGPPARRQRRGGVAVSDVVQPDRRQGGVPAEPSEPLGDRVRVDRPAVGVAGFSPAWPSSRFRSSHCCRYSRGASTVTGSSVL